MNIAPSPIARREKRQRIDTLLQHKALWRASDNINRDTEQGVRCIATKIPEVDALLLHSGWPLGQFIECLHARDNHGAMLPFLPALGALEVNAQTTRPLSTTKILLINPPHLPYQEGWIQQNQQVSDIFVVTTSTLNETLWACEQALRSNSVHAVLLWLSTQKIHFTQLRKLQLAARCSHGLFVTFRDDHALQQASPASLRLHVYPVADKTAHATHNKIAGTHVIDTPVFSTLASSRTQCRIDIIKQSGTRGGQQANLHWHYTLQHDFFPAEQWPVYQPSTQHDHHRSSVLDTMLSESPSNNGSLRIFDGSSNSTPDRSIDFDFPQNKLS